MPGLVLLGSALGISISSTIAITLADIPEATAGSAAGVQSTVLQLATAVGIAVFGIAFFGTIGGADTQEAYLDGLAATLWMSVGLCVVQFVLYVFLPRHLRALSPADPGGRPREPGDARPHLASGAPCDGGGVARSRSRSRRCRRARRKPGSPTRRAT